MQIYIFWNGAHWVARLPELTICGRAVEVRTRVYNEGFTPIFVK